MKKLLFIVIVLHLVACKDKKNELLGIWNVDSKYYSATYKIHEGEGDLVAQALYYNDGTTQYKLASNPDKKKYLFKNLKRKNNVYVDAISGETKKESEEEAQIKILSEDTLLVTTYIMNRPVSEKWIRKQITLNK